MEILFLGTSSGTPTKQRNVTGLALTPESGSGWYLIDCGEGTQHQLLHTPLSLRGLRAIFITHIHGDHCYGLPGLLASAAMSGRRAPLPIIAPNGIEHWIKATQQQTAMYLPFDLEFIAAESLPSWQGDDVSLEATLLSHRVPSYAYCFTDAKLDASLDTDKLIQEQIPKGQIWGRLKKGENVVHEGRMLKPYDYLHYPNKARRIVVSGDNERPELLTETCKGAHVLVHEATYTQDIASKVGDNVQHSAAANVASFAEKLGLPHLVLTHFSPRYQSDVSHSPSIADIQAEASAFYHGQLFLAEDFARYRLNKAGQLTLVLC